MTALILASLFLPLASLAVPGAGAANEEALGTVLRLEGYSIRPPQGFRMERMNLMRGSRAGAVSGSASVPRFLSAALTNGEGEDATSMLISVVESPFEASPSERDEFAEAVRRHYEDLGLKFALERATSVSGPRARIDVLGTVRQENQVRQVLVAAMVGTARHQVVTFSVPSGQWDALAPQLNASLESFRGDSSPGVGRSRVLGLLAAALGLGLAASMVLRRRRRGAFQDLG